MDIVQVNALGDACPIPVVKTKNAIGALKGPGTVVTLVDNQIAVQNLEKMAAQKGYSAKSQQLEAGKYQVAIQVGEGASPLPQAGPIRPASAPQARQVVVISAAWMGEGDDALGRALMKSFLYALSQQEALPATVLFYHSGAALTCEGSPALEDLRAMAQRGVEILTCGTCLSFYGLTDQVRVGQVTNMYQIVEKMTGAGLLVRP